MNPEPEPCLARPPEGGRSLPEKGEAAPAEKKKAARPKKRVRLAEAFRREGLDEHGLARKFRVALEKLSGEAPQGENSGTVEKLLLDALKEYRNIIEPARTASDRAPDAPAIVKLIHRVPRPARKR